MFLEIGHSLGLIPLECDHTYSVLRCSPASREPWRLKPPGRDWTEVWSEAGKWVIAGLVHEDAERLSILGVALDSGSYSKSAHNEAF